MDESERLPAYDPALAHALACGRPDLRDTLLAGALAFLAPGGEVAPLLNPAALRAAPAAYVELAHRGIGLANQAGMPALGALFRALTDALDAARLDEAERLSAALPQLIRAALAAVAAAQTGRR